MHVIGIVGGVASGKSLIAQQLADLGAVVLDADRIGHEVLREEVVEAAARKRWGDAVFGEDGKIDRQKLAKVVFAPPPVGLREREFLESITHPEICRLIRQQIEQSAADGIKSVVIDAPLLLEAGLNDICDKIVFVDAPMDQRLARAKSRGWSEEDFMFREGVQDSLDSKRARADVTIDNSGSSEHTKAQIEQWHNSLAD